MKYTEKYRCNLCSTIWYHEWDTEDYNNDFTQCPNCYEFDYEDLPQDNETFLVKGARNV